MFRTELLIHLRAFAFALCIALALCFAVFVASHCSRCIGLGVMLLGVTGATALVARMIADCDRYASRCYGREHS